MSLKTLQTRLTKLESKIDPPPLIIDCTGAREELLAVLGAGLDDEEEETPIDDELFNELDAALQASIDAIETYYNVRFV